MNAIFAKILYLMEKDIDTMLVTIVSNAGSTPRGTGSQMLMQMRGRVVGTIGGGPAERRAEELAMQLLAKKSSAVHEYRLYKNDEEDIGSVCGGDMTVLFQYIPSDSGVWKALAEALLAQLAAKKWGWFVQRTDGGVPALLDENGALLAGELPADSSALMGDRSVLANGCFSMLLPLGERAVIFGAGHCALALAPVLKSVGFRITVFDERAEWANRENYPMAEQIICGDYTKIHDYLTLTAEDYVVVMTSGHSHDFEVQEQVLRGPLAYIGVIGSKKKTASINKRLRERGITEEAICRVHTPIGVAIKAVTPEEIAVSIAGEMICERALRREAASEIPQ